MNSIIRSILLAAVLCALPTIIIATEPGASLPSSETTGKALDGSISDRAETMVICLKLPPKLIKYSVQFNLYKSHKPANEWSHVYCEGTSFLLNEFEISQKIKKNLKANKRLKFSLSCIFYAMSVDKLYTERYNFYDNYHRVNEELVVFNQDQVFLPEFDTF